MFPKAPAFWWKKNIPWYGLVLSPLSWVWQLGAWMQRRIRERRPLRLPYPVYSVGNAVVGGAGKTPVILALARYMEKKGKIPIIVTKGYGGRLKTSTRVNIQYHRVQDVGDEAWMMAQNYITFVVPQIKGLDHLFSQCPTQSVLLWDDAHQAVHLQAERWLVVDSGQLRGNNRVIPLGPLREPWSVAQERAQGVFWIERRSCTVDSSVPIWCQRTRMGRRLALVPCQGTYEGIDASMGPVIGFCALGYPQKFFDTLQSLTPHVKAFYTFPDHYTYTVKDWHTLRQRAKIHNALLVTTQKDWVKLEKDWQQGVHVVHQTFTFDETTFSQCTTIL